MLFDISPFSAKYHNFTKQSGLLITRERGLIETLLQKKKIPAFSPFSTLFSTIPRRNCNVSVTYTSVQSHLDLYCSQNLPLSHAEQHTG